MPSFTGVPYFLWFMEMNCAMDQCHSLAILGTASTFPSMMSPPPFVTNLTVQTQGLSLQSTLADRWQPYLMQPSSLSAGNSDPEWLTRNKYALNQKYP